MYSAIVLACVFVTFVMTLSHCHRCIEEVKGIFKAIVDPLFSNTNLFAHRIFRRNMVLCSCLLAAFLTYCLDVEYLPNSRNKLLAC